MAITTEIAPNMYRISIFAERGNLQFNHFLVKDAQLADQVNSSNNQPLVQERFPVGRHPSCWPGRGLGLRMRVRRRQCRAPDHPLLFIIEEPVLPRFKAGDDWMPCCLRVLGCVLTRRTITASDVPAFRASAEMKPPAIRGGQAFYTAVATRL